ncbi:Hypothetical protein SCF082_LOCUS32851 [Durusdinium trenchii]|uniref:C2 domain-containing protein n=1 Tax=Durusdinium trenchii TaxID=1381693 RepID=A0ABP0NIW9_9DINO
MAAEWSEWSLKTCVVLCFLNAAALLALGAFPVPWVLLLLGGSLLLQADRALAHLSCWAIARTPKAFHWSIELICVRPSWSFRSFCWSEIRIINWTWHNPPGFEDDARSYILEIDRLSIRLQLSSIFAAIRKRGAIKVKLVCVEGVRFNTQRNEEALLNLWAALHLDDATNEAAIVHGAHHVGGLDAPHMVKPLEHGAKALQADAAQRNFQFRRQDTPLGDALRRPRWGVPFRFDIEQVCVISAKLWLFDLLTLDRRWRPVEPQDTKMEVPCLAFSWETLAKRDPRRDGHADGIRGVYLGELVWVLIAQLLPKVLESSPQNLMKTALFAVGFGAWDATVIMGAKAFELALDAKYCLGNVLPCLPSTEPRPTLDRCFVHVHLICGRGLVRQHNQYCNVLVRLELKNPQTPQGTVADLAVAPLRMWTKSPWWDQKFCLGPATSTSTLVRIRCFHRKARHAMSTKCDGLLGQVVVPLSEILAEKKVSKDGTVVQWFPLVADSMMGVSHGHLKLGFRIVGQRHLSKNRAMNQRSVSCVNPVFSTPMVHSATHAGF